jgi:hypothetical protein
MTDAAASRNRLNILQCVDVDRLADAIPKVADIHGGCSVSCRRRLTT